MAKQININHLRQASEKAKQYVDAQATAQVIRTTTTLYSSETALTTGAGVNIDLTLSNSPTNYDEILIEGGTFIPADNKISGYLSTITIPIDQFTNGQSFNLGREFIYNNDPSMANNWYMQGQYMTATGKVRISNNFVSEGWSSLNRNPGIKRIVGIKYTVPETYTSNEQIVGTWVDGRPIYRKVFSGSMPAVSRGGIAQVATTLKPTALINSGGSMSIRNYSGQAVIRPFGQVIAFAVDGGTTQASWRSGLGVTATGTLSLFFDSPSSSVGDYATSANTYSIWVDYVKG